MGLLRETADRLWAGEQTTHALQPVSLLLGLEQYQDGLAFLSSFGNVTALATREGLVLIDTGSFFLAQQNHATIREWSKLPLTTAVYTHGHVDHAFGVPPFEAEGKGAAKRVEVVAQLGVRERFDRYQLTAGYNRVINERQFGAAAWPTRVPLSGSRVSATSSRSMWAASASSSSTRAARPTITPGLGCPSARSSAPGILFIWASPNCGNPQKVQRYPRDWARALRQMAALEAELLLPGHGLPIEGSDRVEQALLETAELLEFLVDETLERMNRGPDAGPRARGGAGARPGCSSARTCARSTTSPSSSCAICGACMAAGGTATRPT